MTLQASTSFIPEKYRVLSGSALKVLAMAIMLIDHTASSLFLNPFSLYKTGDWK